MQSNYIPNWPLGNIYKPVSWCENVLPHRWDWEVEGCIVAMLERPTFTQRIRAFHTELFWVAVVPNSFVSIIFTCKVLELRCVKALDEATKAQTPSEALPITLPKPSGQTSIQCRSGNLFKQTTSLANKSTKKFSLFPHLPHTELLTQQTPVESSLVGSGPDPMVRGRSWFGLNRRSASWLLLFLQILM